MVDPQVRHARKVCDHRRGDLAIVRVPTVPGILREAYWTAHPIASNRGFDCWVDGTANQEDVCNLLAPRCCGQVHRRLSL